MDRGALGGTPDHTGEEKCSRLSNAPKYPGKKSRRRLDESVNAIEHEPLRMALNVRDQLSWDTTGNGHLFHFGLLRAKNASAASTFTRASLSFAYGRIARNTNPDQGMVYVGWFFQ